MAISRVSTGTIVESASATSITPSLPASLATGDYVVFAVIVPCTSTATETTEPLQSITGWTKIAGWKFVNDTSAIAIFGRFKDGTWSTMPAVTTTHAASRTAALSVAYRGVDPTTPIDAAAVFSGTTTAGTGVTSLAMTGVTTTTAGAMLLNACLVDSSTEVFSPVVPSGMTSLATTTGTADGVAGRGLTLAEESRSTAGATGTRTWAHTTSLGTGGFIFALKQTQAVQKTVTGSITATGAFIKVPTKLPTGSITSTGALVKKVIKNAFPNTITPSGVVVKKVIKNAFPNTITAAGTLLKTKVAPKTLTGSVTATGAIVKKTIKLAFPNTITATGVAVKRTNKAPFTASVTATGALVRSIFRVFTGSITATGFLRNAFVRTFTGSVTATGAMLRTTLKVLTGSTTSTGLLIRKFPYPAFIGSITATGVAVKKTSKALAGSVTPTGFVTKSLARLFTGSVTATGVALKKTLKALSGSTTSTGAFIKVPQKSLAGSIATTGFLRKGLARVFTATVVTAGIAVKKTLKAPFTGSSTATGFYRKSFIRVFTGSIAATSNAIITFIGRFFGRPGEAVVTVRQDAEVIIRIPNN